MKIQIFKTKSVIFVSELSREVGIKYLQIMTENWRLWNIYP